MRVLDLSGSFGIGSCRRAPGPENEPEHTTPLDAFWSWNHQIWHLTEQINAF